MRRASRAIQFALAASLLIGLLLAAHASASIDQGDYTLVNPEVVVDPTGCPACGPNAAFQQGGYVSCPTGQRIVGQGAWWHLPGQGPDPNNARYTSGAPFIPQTWMGSNSATIDALGMFSSGSNVELPRFRQSVLLCLPSSVIGIPYTTVTGDSAPVTAAAGGYLPCPAGQRVVSGGAFWHLPAMAPDQGPTAYTRISSSSPTLDGLGWYADGYNESGSSRVLTTVIHCLPGAGFGPYSVVNPDSAEVPAGSVAGGYVSCPTGQRIVTGGAFWHPTGMGPSSALAGTHTLSSSTPTLDAKGWYADGLSMSNTNARLTTVLLCVASPPGPGLGSKPGKGTSCGGQRATIVGGPRPETLRGTGHKDVIAGLGGADKLVGLGAKDILCGGAGRDTLKGGGANDRLLGGGGRDVCVGGAGNDKASSCATERTI